MLILVFGTLPQTEVLFYNHNYDDLINYLGPKKRTFTETMDAAYNTSQTQAKVKVNPQAEADFQAAKLKVEEAKREAEQAKKLAEENARYKNYIDNGILIAVIFVIAVAILDVYS
jgi:hypothetical protein